MLWKDLRNRDSFTFKDDSKLIQIHETHKFPCYKILYGNYGNQNNITVSEDHYFLCNISKIDCEIKKQLFYEEKLNKKDLIPREYEIEYYTNDKGVILEKQNILKYDSVYVDKNLHWLNAGTIHNLLFANQKISFAKKYKNIQINNSFYQGELDCFCISTDTGQYNCCDIIHHNSVTLRNIIFHALTHSEDIKLGLIDPKLSEFSFYKGMDSIVGVANYPQESVELLRLAREVMYKRNKQNAERQLTDFVDYKPQKPTGKYSLFGTEYDSGTSFKVKIGNEEKEMTIEEMFDYVQETK